MATLLDAHPEVAICYELYEHLLEPLSRRTDHLRAVRRPSGSQLGKQVKTFVSRACRGGVTAKLVYRLLEEHIDAGHGFSSFEDRMRVIERLTTHKMQEEGKSHWGVKIASVYRKLAELYPDESYFLFMQRDGRDILASQKNVGNFEKPPHELAEAWCNQIESFRAFGSLPGVRARLVCYERLTSEPEAEVRRILEFLELSWHPDVMRFYEQDLTLFRNPVGHLSAHQVGRAINTTSVGRWVQDLTQDEVQAFESVAGAMLSELGYAA